MPALANPRHERFARLYMRKGVATEAYLKAGYETTTDLATRVNACRLLAHANVKRRITELKKQMAARNRITVDSLVSELEEDRALARALGQPSAAVAAVQLKARLSGLLIDRKEQGAPGDFTALQTPDEVLAAVRRELGDAAADMLSASLAPAEEKALSETLPEAGTSVN
jgi:hypothetical protein